MPMGSLRGVVLYRPFKKKRASKTAPLQCTRQQQTRTLKSNTRPLLERGLLTSGALDSEREGQERRDRP